MYSAMRINVDAINGHHHLGEGGGGFNVSISCSEFSSSRGAGLLRQLCLRDDCYRFSI